VEVAYKVHEPCEARKLWGIFSGERKIESLVGDVIVRHMDRVPQSHEFDGQTLDGGETNKTDASTHRCAKVPDNRIDSGRKCETILYV
jgi:hypothetical protein